MVCLDLTLINFSEKDLFSSAFEGYSNDFEFTVKGVFRRFKPPLCSDCGVGMNHNGYNVYSKKNLGNVKIGRYICPCCGGSQEEGRDFWERMKEEFFGFLNHIYQVLRVNNVSYGGISDLMEAIFPRGKDTILRAFSDSVEKTQVLPVKDVHILHYDEQHPKKGRTQKYRLTLLDSITGRPLADELSDTKDPETIKKFFKKHLDPQKKVFIVTDMYPSYSDVLEDFFGKNATHQLCLLHLNKRIVKDFPTKTTFEEELTKYRLLNIFYNRDNELSMLKGLVREEEETVKKEKTENQYKRWLKQEMKVFKRFVRHQEKQRRRNKQNLEQRTYFDALNQLNALMDEINSFEKPVQKRLRKIKKNWFKFTAFYFTENAPATNNPLENYYSTSLKTHRKKQLRTDQGIKNHIKLSTMKKAGIITNHSKTLLQIFLKFTPFLNTD